ncbi:hypothetical protein VE03_00667 [Pseudogymnoascus sp. 23342-1-I1]|nr:hypothetical protein VE03_00667 [Pseudogymnoascus sp. 23342-1-I1]
MPPSPTHTALYTLLDLPPTASPSTIKTSYHRLALLTHPDKNPSPTASERFKALSAAYAILSDPKTRAIYDKHGEAAAGRAEAFDDAGDLVVEGAGGETDCDEVEGGNEGAGVGGGGGGGRTTVHSTPREAFEEPVVEQSTYEDRLLEALRAAHERGVEEERRAAGRRLYERFWRGVRGRSGGGGWNWTMRGVEPMDGSCWRAMGDPMEGWRRASMTGGPMEGYHGGPWMYGGGGMVGDFDEGLRERFRRSRGGGEWSPYGGWERVGGEGYGRFRSWSEGGGGGFVRVAREGYGGGYGRY